MALATTADVEALLLRRLTEEELPYVSRLLGMAGQMVITHARLTNTTPPIPPDITYVVSEMVARVLRNPDGFTSEMLGPYQYQRPSTSLALTDDLRAMLSRYGGNGMVVLQLSSVADDVNAADGTWLPLA